MNGREEHRRVQKVIGSRLIPELRAVQSVIRPTEETLPIALELFYTAFAVTNAHQPGALLIARRYAAREGLDAVDVERFAMDRIGGALTEEEDTP